MDILNKTNHDKADPGPNRQNNQEEVHTSYSGCFTSCSCGFHYLFYCVMKYLPLYYKWMKTGMLPRNGLCSSLYSYEGRYRLSLFDPGVGCGGYWAYDGEMKYFEAVLGPATIKKIHRRTFTPLRQTIILFMAAMNNEL